MWLIMLGVFSFVFNIIGLGFTLQSNYDRKYKSDTEILGQIILFIGFVITLLYIINSIYFGI